MLSRGFTRLIPVALEDASVLAALAHPNHLLTVSSWGFARLPPSYTSNSDGYIFKVSFIAHPKRQIDQIERRVISSTFPPYYKHSKFNACHWE